MEPDLNIDAYRIGIPKPGEPCHWEAMPETVTIDGVLCKLMEIMWEELEGVLTLQYADYRTTVGLHLRVHAVWR